MYNLSGLLLSLLQNKGEHISEPELAEFLASLLEFHGSATNKEDKMAEIPAGDVAITLENILPEDVDADLFTGHILVNSQVTRVRRYFGPSRFSSD